MDKHNEEHIYVAIDLKSFYASVECRERGKDALTTNLVVADPTRTEKTICLAVSPALKAYGIPGRARLFEVVQRVKEVNKLRLSKLMASGHVAGTVPETFRGRDRKVKEQCLKISMQYYLIWMERLRILPKELPIRSCMHLKNLEL